MKVVSNLVRYGGISERSDFASRNRDTYLSFVLKNNYKKTPSNIDRTKDKLRQDEYSNFIRTYMEVSINMYNPD